MKQRSSNDSSERRANGLLAQLVRVLGCQPRDHGFESRIDRERLFFEDINKVG